MIFILLHSALCHEVGKAQARRFFIMRIIYTSRFGLDGMSNLGNSGEEIFPCEMELLAASIAHHCNPVTARFIFDVAPHLQYGFALQNTSLLIKSVEDPALPCSRVRSTCCDRDTGIKFLHLYCSPPSLSSSKAGQNKSKDLRKTQLGSASAAKNRQE
jgi:hypothetical protein